MKHAGPEALDRIEPLLESLRALDGLKEKSRGCFYLGGKAFLHFHQHGDSEMYADIRRGGEFERFPAVTSAQHKAILKLAAKALTDGKRLAKR